MKKLVALLLCLLLAVPMATVAEEKVDITLWVYPVGSWADAGTVNGFVSEFHNVHPDISVTVRHLESDDDQLTSAIRAGTAPDMILAGPERLVADWGAAGKMLDISDLWTDEALADISATSESIVNACKGNDGIYYAYPLCMTTYCMVIDRAAFAAADALQYIDEETRTWTTEDFENALRALSSAGSNPVAIVDCGVQYGDEGVRALVNNLFSGTFTNEEHTAYTADSPENIQALQKLVDLVNEGVLAADPSGEAYDENELFCNGTVKMSFSWSASAASSLTSLTEETEIEPLPMAFPSDDGIPELCGDIWGFGIFDNKDEARASAAKEFIRFICDDAVQGPQSVYATGFFPVRASFGDIYINTEKGQNSEFTIFSRYLGDLYQVSPGWTAQRAEWRSLLQRVFEGGDVAAEVAAYVTNANASINVR